MVDPIDLPEQVPEALGKRGTSSFRNLADARHWQHGWVEMYAKLRRPALRCRHDMDIAYPFTPAHVGEQAAHTGIGGTFDFGQ